MEGLGGREVNDGSESEKRLRYDGANEDADQLRHDLASALGPNIQVTLAAQDGVEHGLAEEGTQEGLSPLAVNEQH